MLIDFIFTVIIISAFCVGLFATMEDGNLLHFLRAPIDRRIREYQDIREERESKAERERDRAHSKAAQIDDPDQGAEIILRSNGDYRSQMEFAKSQYDRSMKKFYFLKPLMLCIKCMASFWGSLVYVAIHISTQQDERFLYLLPAALLSAVFLNQVFFGLFVKNDV